MEELKLTGNYSFKITKAMTLGEEPELIECWVIMLWKEFNRGLVGKSYRTKQEALEALDKIRQILN